jgi:hypothetical protein
MFQPSAKYTYFTDGIKHRTNLQYPPGCARYRWETRTVQLGSRWQFPVHQHGPCAEVCADGKKTSRDSARAGDGLCAPTPDRGKPRHHVALGGRRDPITPVYRCRGAILCAACGTRTAVTLAPIVNASAFRGLRGCSSLWRQQMSSYAAFRMSDQPHSLHIARIHRRRWARHRSPSAWRIDCRYDSRRWNRNRCRGRPHILSFRSLAVPRAGTIAIGPVIGCRYGEHVKYLDVD